MHSNLWGEHLCRYLRPFSPNPRTLKHRQNINNFWFSYFIHTEVQLQNRHKWISLSPLKIYQSIEFKSEGEWAMNEWWVRGEMGRTAAGKHRTTKFVLVLVGLLGLFLMADLLWASSSSSSSNWALQDSNNFIVPQPVHSNNSTLNTPNKVGEFT